MIEEEIVREVVMDPTVFLSILSLLTGLILMKVAVILRYCFFKGGNE